MFQLDYKSHKTISEQIVDKIKELIMIDILQEDEKLPSVRELSRTLTVNPNTIQKAFKELDRQGYIYTVTGKGTFISSKKNIKQDPEKVEKVLETIKDSYKQLLYMGISEEEALDLVVHHLKEEG